MNNIKDFKHFTIPADIDKSIDELKNNNPQKWTDLGKKKAIDLANYTILTTPAYKKYIEKNGFSETVITADNFSRLPLIDKNDYLKKHAYKDLFPNGDFSKVSTISSTSGSTGEPFYFPRGEEQDQQYEYVAEIYMKEQFEIDKKTTLAINGFGLGIWIGGIYTYKNINRLAQKGYPIAMAPIGVIKELYLQTIKKQAEYFDQIILMGYPPFIKDILDEAVEYDIDFNKYNVKIMTATEAFSEIFRDYLIEKANIKNPLKDIINIYGSVELGTMSHETALSVLIRRIAVKKPEVYKVIFGDASLLPTLVQYHPYIVYFEQLGEEVIATGMGSSIPLVRYKFHDRGGIIYFDDMVNRLKSVGVDILEEAKDANIDDTIMKLPFVYVYERTDFVVLVKGANVYPENIKIGLQQDSVRELVTGRFTMEKKQDKSFEDYLLVHVELKKNHSINHKNQKIIKKAVFEILARDNTEFRYTQEYSKNDILHIQLHKHEDPEYFSRDVIKHRWVKK